MMLRLHMFPEPPPGSSQMVQDEGFARLRTTLQKQLELTIQFQAMGSIGGGVTSRGASATCSACYDRDATGHPTQHRPEYPPSSHRQQAILDLEIHQ